MRYKFFLLLTIIFYFNTGYTQLLGWSFDEVVRLKGKEFATSAAKDGSTVLSYKSEKSLVNGKEYPVGSSEVYHISSTTNKVKRYVFIGLKRESDIIDIIEKNNAKYKKVDLGSKQNFYQWIDIENNSEYTLSIQMQVEDNKFILYNCELVE